MATSSNVPRRGSGRTGRIEEILEDLVRQRQSLRASGARDGKSLLEANRRSIVYWQAELARTLLDEHDPRDAS